LIVEQTTVLFLIIVIVIVMVRLASIEYKGKVLLAAQLRSDGGDGCCYCDLSSIASDARSFLQGGAEALEQAQVLIASSSRSTTTTTTTTPRRIRADECRLLAPIDGSLVGKFLCVGMNYVDHCTEQNIAIPTEPLIFSKFGSSIAGPGDPVAACDFTQKLDYEVELGVVIGQVIPRNTTAEQVRQQQQSTSINSMRMIGGFTVVHDVSARDWQMERNGGQWTLGKAGDGFAPIGPVIVTADEMDFEAAHHAGIRCRVNGETLQNSNTSNLIHKVDQIIAFVSQFMTLYPGDIIATGTPPGVGCFRKPFPRWLIPGDVVECEIDGIGTLVTPIVEKLQSLQHQPAPPLPAAPVAAASTSTATSTNTGRLQGMTCIVTGGARGIGYGIAARLGIEGAAHVSVVDLEQDSIDQACASLQEIAPSCQYTGHTCDVGDVNAVTQIWAKIADDNDTHRIDILVQAAGIVGATNVKTEDVDPDNFDAVFRVNVRGIFNGCKSVLPYMRQQGYGRIVNIASIAGKEGNAGEWRAIYMLVQ
jgi:2-keto-4-pentenoate hydratase/2-oxohepta-3-ene-1,7-dioic acid hydratase in catechol pathway